MLTYVLLYLLHTYINVVKCLQKALLDVSINWRYLHEHADLFRKIKDKIILQVFKRNHLQAYEKEYWRLSGYKRIIKEGRQNCVTKSYYKPSACKKG